MLSPSITPGLVSIVIPAFNRKCLLAEAVESCLAQTYPEIEILIVDDGSTDHTDNFVNAKLGSDWKGKNIHFWRQDNQGVSVARQFGLECATGEFVQFLDSDDQILPDKIELQVEALLNGGEDAVCCSCYGRKGEQVFGWEKAQRIGFKGETVLDYIHAMCSPVSYPMQCNAPLWRRRYLLQQPGWPVELSCGEDWSHYTRLIVNAKKIVFVEDDLFWLRDHDGERLSATTKSRVTHQKAVSFSKSLQAVANVIGESGLLDRQCRTGLLKISRSIYMLLLEAGEKEDLEQFEASIKLLEGDPRKVSALSIASWFRYLFGTSLTFALLKFYVRKGRDE